MVRYGVLAFLGAMTFVLYLDRVCIGQAAPQIQKELGISETWMGGRLHRVYPLLRGLRDSRPGGGATATAPAAC